MKLTVFLLVFILSLSCKQKSACEWRTVDNLNKLDFTQCRPAPPDDSMYIYMNLFSAGYNTIREEKGIPVLPGDFEAEVYSVNNQVRWHGDVENGEWVERNKPFLKWKTLEWDKHTLLYDRNLFVEDPKKDRYGNSLWIAYELDTLSAGKEYFFQYQYEDSNRVQTELNKYQADSILKAWNLDH